MPASIASGGVTFLRERQVGHVKLVKSSVTVVVSTAKIGGSPPNWGLEQQIRGDGEGVALELEEVACDVLFPPLADLRIFPLLLTTTFLVKKLPSLLS